MPSEIVSGLFQPVLAFYRLFQVVLLFRSNDVTECFDLHFYFKATSCRCYYKVGQLWCMYYKVGQVLLQRGTAFCISKLDKWYDKVRHVLQITANCHTKCRTFHRTFSIKNGCSLKFRKIHRKRPTSELSFIKLQASGLWDSDVGIFLLILRNF